MQGELFTPVHKSRQQRRLRYKGSEGYVNAERIYAAEWIRLNRPSGTYPRGLLELILRHDDGTIPTISQRDAEVAAGVIQWLGTNVGGGFLRGCEDRIERARNGNAPVPALSNRPAFEVTRRIDLDEG